MSEYSDRVMDAIEQFALLRGRCDVWWRLAKLPAVRDYHGLYQYIIDEWTQDQTAAEHAAKALHALTVKEVEV